jgi:hypothetical protein
MSTPSIRAALDRLHEYAVAHPEHDSTKLVAAARAALAQPEAGEVARFTAWLQKHAGQCVELGRPDWAHMAARAATLLQQLSAPTPPAPEPVAVSERLPDPRPEPEGGDCDAGGRCWWFSESHEGLDTAPAWALTWRSDDDTHWRPFRAIPLPQAGEVEA